MRHITNRARAAVVAATIAGLALTSFSSAQAEPEVTVEDVERAFAKAGDANERVLVLGEQIKAAKSEIETINTDIARDQERYDAQKDQLGAAIVQQQLDAPLGPTVNLLGSEDPAAFLDGLGAIQALNSTRADALENFATTSRKLENRKAQVEDRQDDLAESQSEAEAERAKLKDSHEAAEAELERLNAADQASFNESETEVEPDFEVDASGRAKQAVDFAMSQLGDPYSYGGTGPDSWDCSGLTQAAYGAAGVSIGRVVGAQASEGRSVPMGSLQPGDLVVYGDHSHIGMFIGNGKVVHSPRPGKTVEVTGLSGFSKARRIVG